MKINYAAYYLSPIPLCGGAIVKRAIIEAGHRCPGFHQHRRRLGDYYPRSRGTDREVVGFRGKLVFDTSKPDGTSRKLQDISRLHALGWQAKTVFREGIAKAYADFLQNVLKAA